MHKRILVLGAGGFIGNHLVSHFKNMEQWGGFDEHRYSIIGVDLKLPEYNRTEADQFYQFDLRDPEAVKFLFRAHQYDEVYQLAADMGGAGYIFSEQYDADIMYNSSLININVLHNLAQLSPIPKVFYSSSACVYPAHNQMDPDNPYCEESSAHPANPDSEYGWEKLFSEHLYLSYHKNKGVPVAIARFHNIYGPYGAWNNGREKAPAALCRKVAEAGPGGTVEIWGDGQQTRTFLYIDECIEGMKRLMASDCIKPLNIGSDEIITINDLAYLVAHVAGYDVKLKHIQGPLGVRGRCSHNELIQTELGWAPTTSLRKGLDETFPWIQMQVENAKASS